MTKEELIQEFTGIFGDWIKVLKIDSVEHRPHLYMIGPKHIEHAQQFGGILSEECIIDGEKHGVHCYVPGCTASLDQHTYKTGVFIQLKQDVPNNIMATLITKAQPILDAHGLEGFILVDTPEKFRVKPPIEES